MSIKHLRWSSTVFLTAMSAATGFTFIGAWLLLALLRGPQHEELNATLAKDCISMGLIGLQSGFAGFLLYGLLRRFKLLTRILVALAGGFCFTIACAVTTDTALHEFLLTEPFEFYTNIVLWYLFDSLVGCFAVLGTLAIFDISSKSRDFEKKDEEDNMCILSVHIPLSGQSAIGMMKELEIGLAASIKDCGSLGGSDITGENGQILMSTTREKKSKVLSTIRPILADERLPVGSTLKIKLHNSEETINLRT